MSAGWSCYDWLLVTRKDSDFDKDKLLAMLNRVRPNRTKYAMNNFIMSVADENNERGNTLSKKKRLLVTLIAITIIFSFLYFYFKAPYKISKDNVKSIYCTYSDNTGYYQVQVSDSDKEIILSEVSKMRDSHISGEIGTVYYNFTIELTNGDKFTFHENTPKTISLYSSQNNFFRNIKASKTAEFIERFTDEHKIQRY